MKRLVVLFAVILLGATQSRAQVQYRLAGPIDDAEQIACAFNDQQLALLEKLNRCDRDQLVKLPGIVVPSKWDRHEAEYSPLPNSISWAEQLPKTIIVHKPLQAFGAYESGELVHWGPVSTGAEKSRTPNGAFFLNWRSTGHRSTVNQDWFLRWYFNFHNDRGHSFHQYQLPGVPASHGCVRLLSRDAQWIYEWGEEWELDERGWNIETQGSPVVLVGEYDFQNSPPWREPSLVESGFELSRNGYWLSREALNLARAQLADLLGPDDVATDD